MDKIRAITGEKRVGHGGTLDPLAQGVLVVAVGRQNTKKLEKYAKGEKEYLATLNLGEVSVTDDSEGPIHEYILSTDNSSHLKNIIIPSIQDVRICTKKFVGKILQTPPNYSSIKVRGKPAHRRIRGGQKIELKPREVFINKIEVVSYDYPVLELRVECGSGVYIRSLARDLGKCLQTGAYLTRLVRTRVGDFKIEDCLRLEELS